MSAAHGNVQKLVAELSLQTTSPLQIKGARFGGAPSAG